MGFKSLPNDKILDVTKLKAFADDKIKVAQMTISVFDKVKTLWEKEKMLVTRIFSFSYNVLKRLLVSRLLKVGIVWKWVNFSPHKSDF